MPSLCVLSAIELPRLIGTRVLSPIKLLKNCEARITEVNPTLKAVTATILLAAGAGKRRRQSLGAATISNCCMGCRWL